MYIHFIDVNCNNNKNDYYNYNYYYKLLRQHGVTSGRVRQQTITLTRANYDDGTVPAPLLLSGLDMWLGSHTRC